MPSAATNVARTVVGVVELSLTTTVEPTSAVPDSVGVASFVKTGDTPLTTGTAGAEVSKVSDSVDVAVLVFPAVSVNAPPAIESDADPPLMPTAGVKTNVYCVDETATKVPSDPPVIVTSVKINVEEGSES